MWCTWTTVTAAVSVALRCDAIAAAAFPQNFQNFFQINNIAVDRLSLEFSELPRLFCPWPPPNSFYPLIFIRILPQFNFSSVVPGRLSRKQSRILRDDSRRPIILVSFYTFTLTRGRCEVLLFSVMVNWSPKWCSFASVKQHQAGNDHEGYIQSCWQ